jgi:hypothetical protein
MQTIHCIHCGRIVPRNRKLKHLDQHYCGSKECQRSRKRKFDLIKYQSNPAFKTEKLKESSARRKRQKDQNTPTYFSRYQRFYRESHADYVTINREKQRDRYKRKKEESSQEGKIVNPDALMSQTIDNEQVYAMYKVDYKKIVNPDALMMQPPDIEMFTSDKPMFVRLL